MMIFDLDDKKVEEIRDILGTLYIKNGPTDEVVRLSQWVDTMVVSTQKERQKFYEEATS